MNILLTGGFGFIGRHLSSHLASKFTVFAPAHSELDVLDSAKVLSYAKANSIDAVVHAANVGGSRKDENNSEVYSKNLQMFLNIAALEPLVGKIIFYGTGAEYDKSASISMVLESDFGKNLPKDEYGKAKFACSQEIAKMHKAINLRCFGVYGIYEDYELRFISYAILRALLGLPIILKQDTLFEYTYVKDVCRLTEYFLENDAKEKFYNLGSGRPVSLLFLAKIVQSLTKSSLPITVLKPGMGKEYTCNSDRLKLEVKNFIFTPYEQAIQEMIDWYKANLNLLNLEKIKAEMPV